MNTTTEHQEFKKSLTFKKTDFQITVDIEYKNKRLSIMGSTYEKSRYGSWRNQSAGQIQDQLIADFPRNKKAVRLYAIWTRWHLNDMNAGDKTQEDYLRELKAKGWEYGNYENACAALREAGLLTHNGYKYGSDWKFEEVPQTILDELRAM